MNGKINLLAGLISHGKKQLDLFGLKYPKQNYRFIAKGNVFCQDLTPYLLNSLKFGSVASHASMHKYLSPKLTKTS
jgi:hypothetical protein